MKAAVLLERWTRVSRRHVAASFGCGCGGAAHVTAYAFEQDLLEFLRDRHPGQVHVGSLGALLREADDAALLADVERSVRSWERASGGLRAD